MGRLVGVDDHELRLSRAGRSSDPRVAAALGFARTVNAKRGAVSDDDFGPHNGAEGSPGIDFDGAARARPVRGQG